ncbi:alpha-ketoglutarate-dependent dioxygenase alkB homolog 3 isoform X2 [Megalops cyprinoides]|uniref:alpha-ketoglutarate-dependent dioxygenase alkB homolog 3 isoform X2 n=1 Tax=Megalops cyprinoides TaxID=118141 RepID=UPI0018652861|nr:alpha-ketoglutarate-dependent dioxygenase alkB homolog 3 isoform X2 [Megalops cyprinoides]
MGDKRQRARVQGSWAASLPKPAPSAKGVAGGNIGSPGASVFQTGAWGERQQTFKFHQPAKPLRDIPAEKVIKDAGDYAISHGPSGVSRLRLIPGFLPQTEADWMFSQLYAELPWSQKTNFRLGQAYLEPRLTCWYGDLPYTYSNSKRQANPQWHAVLNGLKDMVEQASRCSFNSLLCNLYRDGKDSIAWHSDNEPSLGPHPTIASLSLGDTRCFSMRKKPAPEENGDYTCVEKLRIPLVHGTLLIMEGATQEDWQVGHHFLCAPGICELSPPPHMPELSSSSPVVFYPLCTPVNFHHPIHT